MTAVVEASALVLPVEDGVTVSALFTAAPTARAVLVLAHGAGAGMTHPFMAQVADGLAARGIATLRFQFPFMEKGSRRPDSPALAQATVRAAVLAANDRAVASRLPVFAGGKSFGGRMTSQAAATSALPGVRGLVFFGFPLHPAGKPGIDRAAHLGRVTRPMLFLQGERDKLADLGLLRPVVDALGAMATLNVERDADHSFHVPVRSGRRDGDVLADLLDTAAAWMIGIADQPAPRPMP